MKTMTMQALKDQLTHLAQGEVVLDVRSPEEFSEGHIAGARNIPHDEVLSHVEELKKFKTVFVHCHAGGRAQVAAMDLESAGLTNLVCIPGSGMRDWLAAGFPVTR